MFLLFVLLTIQIDTYDKTCVWDISIFNICVVRVFKTLEFQYCIFFLAIINYNILLGCHIPHVVSFMQSNYCPIRFRGGPTSYRPTFYQSIITRLATGSPKKGVRPAQILSLLSSSKHTIGATSAL